MTVTLPYDPVWTALAWAKENCPSYITNEAVDTAKMKRVPGGWVDDTRIVYFFGDEKDALMFTLKWA
jgi:hypothetical protein